MQCVTHWLFHQNLYILDSVASDYNVHDSELDRTAELDSYRFWRMVKSRRKNTSENLGSGIKFNGVTVRDRQQITDNWWLYFKSLYTSTDIVDYEY